MSEKTDHTASTEGTDRIVGTVDEHRDELLTVDTVAVAERYSRLRLRGELDVASIDLLKAALSNERRNRRMFVGLDLTELRFCDGTGIYALDRERRRFAQAGGELTFTGVPAQVTKLMKLTSLSALLHSTTARPDPEAAAPQRADGAPVEHITSRPRHLHLT